MQLASGVLCVLMFAANAAVGSAQATASTSQESTAAPTDESKEKSKPAADEKPMATDAASGAPAPYFLNVSLGVQATSRDLVAPGAFPIYEEAAIFETRGETGDGFLFDVGGGYRVWRRLYAAVSYSVVGGNTGGPVTGQVPDVLLTDRLRPITGSASGLSHREHAIHFQGVWRHPISKKIDVALSAGPTLFVVSQELVRQFAVIEPTPTMGDVTVTDVSRNAVGFNVGVDGAYMVTPRITAGLLVRYAGGSVDLPTPGGDLGAPGAPAEFSLDVGGLQVGAGVRIRFSRLRFW